MPVHLAQGSRLVIVPTMLASCCLYIFPEHHFHLWPRYPVDAPLPQVWKLLSLSLSLCISSQITGLRACNSSYYTSPIVWNPAFITSIFFFFWILVSVPSSCIQSMLPCSDLVPCSSILHLYPKSGTLYIHCQFGCWSHLVYELLCLTPALSFAYLRNPLSTTSLDLDLSLDYALQSPVLTLVYPWTILCLPTNQNLGLSLGHAYLLLGSSLTLVPVTY